MRRNYCTGPGVITRAGVLNMLRRLFFLVTAALALSVVQAQTLLALAAVVAPASRAGADASAASAELREARLRGAVADAATRAASGRSLSTIEQTLADAQTALDLMRLEDEDKAETFEDAEHNRFTAMLGQTTLSWPTNCDALAAHHQGCNHGTAFDIDEYPLGVALHRPSARADDAYNTRIVALATPTGMPPDLFDVSKGHRGPCSRRCTSFASCAGFAWKRAVREECVFFRAPDGIVAMDRAGELVPGGLPLEMNADWNWYAKPTQNSEVRQA